MDVNQWDYLMGTKKGKGHDASVYNLNFTEKLIANYETYLVRKLSLDNTFPDDTDKATENNTIPPTEPPNDSATIQELKATIARQNAIKIHQPRLIGAFTPS